MSLNSFVKVHIKSLFLVFVLMIGPGLVLTNPATAQTFMTLHSFTNSPDGSYPQCNLVLSGNTLYGTATAGGSTNNYGTVFAVNTSGLNYTNLYTFGLTNSDDGGGPQSGLVLSGNALYGTTGGGGVNGAGTVFAINTNGSNYVTLYNLSGPEVVDDVTFLDTNRDGADPQESGLVLSGNTLYGTAFYGGVNGAGTVFAVNTSGSNFMVLHTFGPSDYNADNAPTNSDGVGPESTLLLSGNTLYGSAAQGGTNGNGTLFAMNTSGSNFMVLHTFGAYVLDPNTGAVTNDGVAPQGAGLILSENTLYGTTCLGGTNNGGTVFSLNTNGSNYTVLHNFTGGADGAAPFCGVVLSGNTLYGTATEGGTNGGGTVFSLKTNGTNFTVLHSFNPAPDGAQPRGLMLFGSTLYGTTAAGGSTDNGTVFSLAVTLPVAPQLAIALSGTNVILNWPTNAAGFNLEFATNLVSPVWNTNLPAPVVVNTNNAVTNGISGTQKFYRLSQ
jgi:uncharacterized repeat protein (TIGR03803 family)